MYHLREVLCYYKTLFRYYAKLSVKLKLENKSSYILALPIQFQINLDISSKWPSKKIFQFMD